MDINNTDLPEARPIHGLLFDFDGTLTEPGALDFNFIRQEIGCPPDEPVLEFIAKIADSRRQTAARKALDNFERKAASCSKPNPAAANIVRNARKAGLKIGILTRNTMACVEIALSNFDGLTRNDFDLIITREDRIAPKPAPDGIMEAARRWNLETSQLLIVGDFWFDVEAGRRAGSLTVWLDAGTMPAELLYRIKADYHISSLKQLEPIINKHRPLAAGKLPAPMLEKLLSEFQMHDPALIVAPGPGQDTAALKPEKGHLLVVKADPITFATEQIGRYTVAVNANDIATAGARPCWLLATILLPAGITFGQVRAIFASLYNSCRRSGITLCGGHTEITDAVTRPIVSGAMMGTVAPDRLIDKAEMAPGDFIIITKKVAVEATALMARQFADLLASKGVDRQIIDRAAGLLEKIGVTAEANIAAAGGRATAMHDVTEGGVATAIDELATAGRCRLEIDLDSIPIYSATQIFCRALGLDPLGVIGSGSLLIACRPEYHLGLIAELRAAGIPATPIGRAIARGSGVDARRKGRPARWPVFEVDEIARLYQRPVDEI